MEALIEDNNPRWCNAFFWPPLGSVSVIRGCAKSDLPTGFVLGSGPTAPGMWRTSELRGLLEITGCGGGVPRPLGACFLSRAPIQGMKGWGLSATPLLHVCMGHIQIPLCLYIFPLLYMLVYISGHGKKLKYMIDICFLQILCLEIAVEFVASYRNNHFKNFTANCFF